MGPKRIGAGWEEEVMWVRRRWAARERKRRIWEEQWRKPTPLHHLRSEARLTGTGSQWATSPDILLDLYFWICVFLYLWRKSTPHLPPSGQLLNALHSNGSLAPWMFLLLMQPPIQWKKIYYQFNVKRKKVSNLNGCQRIIFIKTGHLGNWCASFFKFIIFLMHNFPPSFSILIMKSKKDYEDVEWMKNQM